MLSIRKTALCLKPYEIIVPAEPDFAKESAFFLTQSKNSIAT